MPSTHTLAIAACCAFALAACNETPPPNDKTAMTTPEAMTLTKNQPAVNGPISSPALPGPVGSDATPAPQTPPPGTASEGQAPTGENATQAKSTAVDSPATNPTAPLSKDDEVNAMPLAGHGNNHSSPSLAPPEKQ